MSEFPPHAAVWYFPDPHDVVQFAHLVSDVALHAAVWY
jgi:hypothetical protein